MYVTSVKPQSHSRIRILPSTVPDSRDFSACENSLEQQVLVFSSPTTLEETLGVGAGTKDEF